MTTFSKLAFVTIFLGTFMQPASAYVLNGVDIGIEDTFLGFGSGINGQTAETNFVTGLAGTAVVFETKNESEPTASLVASGGSVDTNDLFAIFAFELTTDPEYFIIKNSTYTAAYSNNEKSGWAVFDALKLGEDFNYGLDKLATNDGLLEFASSLTISHFSEFSGSVPVPEPGTLALLGLGLAGLTLTRTRKSS